MTGNNATYGLDTLGLGNTEASGGPSLDNQVVAAITGTQNVLGVFGLGREPTNLTDFTDPRPSFLSNLHSQRMIPTLSWAYTAGARYRLKGVFGSLTLGGYDTSRFIPNDVSFNLAPDISRDLVVGLQSITVTESNGTKQLLLPSAHFTFIDSSVTDLYLPVNACEAFEKELGLQWNATLKMYPVSDELHQELLTRDPTFTFEIGNTITGGPTVKITMPYSGFSLNYMLSFDSSTRYFPIRRTREESRYTLGRMFLQEAYLITNYEQGNFSVSQAKFEEPMEPQIVPILPDSGNLTTTTSQKSVSNPGFAKTVHIIVGAVTGSLLLLAFCWWFWRRRHLRKRKQITPTSPALSSAEDIQQAFAAEINQDLASRSDPSLPSSKAFYRSEHDHVPEIDRNSRNFVREVHDNYVVELADTGRRAELARAATPDPPNGQMEEAREPRPRNRHGLVLSNSSLSSAGNFFKFFIGLYGSRASQGESATGQETAASSRSVDPYLQRPLPPTPIDESLQESDFPAWTKFGARRHEEEDVHPAILPPNDSFLHRMGFF
ncbi:MAG: hypothetical protein Q9193_004318 [Seirophora villosa]